MKTYLATYEITDGQHEHTDYGLVKAKNQDEAVKLAKKSEHEFLKGGQEPTYFDYGDGTTTARCKSVIELSELQVTVIGELGLAYYINK